MKQLNMEQLEYVVEAAKTGSLSKAAQRYYVSLSAVSQAISILEAELGLVIFTRSRGSFSKHVTTGSQDIIAIELDVPDEKPIYYGWAMRKGKQSSLIAKQFIQRLDLG